MADLHEYKCLACGGALEFNSAIQKLKCPYCDSEYEMSALQNVDEELNQAAEQDAGFDSNTEAWSDSETDGMRVYVCKSCGGEIVGDANTAATSCPYCGNPIVMMGQFKGDLKPDYVIPFKLNKDQAMEAYNKHISGKKLLPRIFKDQNRIKEIQGVYVPFWLFDAQSSGQAVYEATKSRSWKDNQYAYKETSYFDVQRGGYAQFQNVPVDGSKKMDDTLMQSLEPFNFGEAQKFQTAYLAGYVADRYDVSKEESIGTAKERIKNSTKAFLDSTVQGYETVNTSNANIAVTNATSKYALYPVWMMTTQYENEKYTFAMNGQTGKFVGDLPIDKNALAKRVALTAVITFVVTFLLSFLMFDGFDVMGLAGAAIITAIAAAITNSSSKASMISVRQETKAGNYTVNQGLTMQNDYFKYNRTERTPLNNQNQQGGPGAPNGMNQGGQMNGARPMNGVTSNNAARPMNNTSHPMNNASRPMNNTVRPTNNVSRPMNTGAARPSGSINVRTNSGTSRPAAPRSSGPSKPIGRK